MRFDLLNKINTLLNETTVDIPTERQHSSDISNRQIVIPDAILKSLRTRIKALEDLVDKKKGHFLKNGEVMVPAVTNADADRLRQRIGDEASLELLYMLESYMKNSPVDYRDYTEMLTRMYTYNNNMRSNVPDDVVKFIHVQWKWDRWDTNKLERSIEHKNTHPDTHEKTKIEDNEYYRLVTEADEERERKRAEQEQTSSRPTDYADPDELKFGDDIFNRKDSPLGKPEEKKAKQDKKSSKAGDPRGSTASASTTRSKVAGINNPEAAEIARQINQDFLNDLADANDEPDLDQDYDNAVPELPPPTPENLPAVISRELRAAGMVSPEWHQVKNLPGYINRGIRALGRQMFSQVFSTDIDEVQVLANLGGSGPNSTQEMNAVAGFVKANGVQRHDIEMGIENLLPGGYEAQTFCYNWGGYDFLLVKDFAGEYIYSWPADDTLINWDEDFSDLPPLDAPQARLN